MNIEKKRAAIAKSMLAVLRAEIKENLIDTKENDPDGYEELVELYLEQIGGEKRPTMNQLVDAEKDTMLGAGDSMRDWLDSFSDDIYAAYEETIQHQK